MTPELLTQTKHHFPGAGAPTVAQYDYEHDQNRSIAKWTLLQRGEASEWAFGYDEIRQLVSAKRTDGADSTMADERYAYDEGGNRVSRVGLERSRNGAFNGLNQLEVRGSDGPTLFGGTVDEPATVRVNDAPAKVTMAQGTADYRFEKLVTLSPGENVVTIEAEDASGNETTRQFAVLADGARVTLHYDRNGNLIREVDEDGVTIRDFRWDQRSTGSGDIS